MASFASCGQGLVPVLLRERASDCFRLTVCQGQLFNQMPAFSLFAGSVVTWSYRAPFLVFPEEFSWVGTACTQSSSIDRQDTLLDLSGEWLLLMGGAGSQIRCLLPAYFWGSSGTDVCGSSP